MLNAYLSVNLVSLKLPVILQFQLMAKLLTQLTLMTVKQNVTLW